MKISFILLHYNQSKYIKDSIFSLIYSGLNSNELEIIILDDGSEENEVENLKSIISKIQLNFKIDIILICETNNTKNQSRLRNLGIKLSSGDYIAFLDGDDFINSYELNCIYQILNNSFVDVLFPTRLIGWNTPYKSYNKLIVNPNDVKTYGCGISHYIIKKNILFKYNIFFNEDKYYFYAEDLLFFCLLLDNIKQNNITYQIYESDWYYCGLKRPTSTFINSKTLNKSNIIYWIQYSKYLKESIKDPIVLKYGLETCLKLLNLIKNKGDKK